MKDGTELGLGFTHEENITNVFSHIVNSYKDLPLMAYQFQNKLRNETRAKSGIMRTREFIMKDAYTFCLDIEQHNIVYEKIKNAYIRIFNRLGIGDKTFITFASGGVFSKYSHEFQTICDSGEDDIYINIPKNIAINKEVMTDEALNDLGVKREELEMVKASEVGNIFDLGTKFSEPLNLKYKNEEGDELPVVMGSYGIGPARVMGVITELLSDDKGIVWPMEIAPYQLHLISLSKDKNDNVYKKSEEIYNKLRDNNVEIL
ncbi:MAG: hypothetical protein ORN26_00840 [Candidatus Pacebacteria bacterium]|nr:hypothetical protein [Candidatus Paceibacterota bacterium]